jgi:hypothetical protein
MPPGGGNDTYWGNSMNSSSRTPADPLRTGAPPPWRSGEYVPVNMLHTFKSAPLLMLLLYEAVSPIRTLWARRRQQHRVPGRC